ncbi:3-hydroxybenzoate 6-hydroxylase [Mycena sanguinolenta]|uniref:3-hydroxybenzoate 6-hydroxylase n=1 Tax=Mycena sanguinolenta TaxID=230812 RepID=A0A8H7CQH4_9AGAR|nr:3-hydroxybenzoate 6-hydroxylase [Mycena sanguinolenta]
MVTFPALEGQKIMGLNSSKADVSAQSPKPQILHFIIVGCGLGGLAAAYCLGRAGHAVTVFESAPRIADVGAGIQISPNMSRLLIRWGLGDALRAASMRPETVTLGRYDTGERLSRTKWGAKAESEHGAPYLHIHRASLLEMLLSLASPYMTLHLNSKVTSVNPDLRKVTLDSGAEFTADAILGADGLKSVVREVVVGSPISFNKPMSAADAAYRAIIPISDMCRDPDLKSLVDHPELTLWIGPERHIVGYCIIHNGCREYNLVMVHPNTSGLRETYELQGCMNDMLRNFVGWEPRIQKLLALVPQTLVWPLFDFDPLQSWVHPSGRVGLLGDACHPMLPCWAQGSAMAIEDAAVLGVLFSHITSVTQIPSLLQAYQTIRHQRTTETHLASRMNKKIFHLPDGPEQEARDLAMRLCMKDAQLEERGEDFVDRSAGNPDAWADRAKSRNQFGYDAEEAAEQWWRTLGCKCGD